MRVLLSFVVLFALLQSACEESTPLYVPVASSSGGGVSGGSSGSAGGLFAGLSGQFDLGDGCTLLLTGSSGTLDCEFRGSYNTSDYVDLYDLELLIQETAITATVREVYIETSAVSASEDYEFVAVADVSANRESGRRETGRFSALAGTWTGRVGYAERDTTYRTGAPISRDLLTIYEFRAEVYGERIAVAWAGTDGDSGGFGIESSFLGVTVDGEFFREL